MCYYIKVEPLNKFLGILRYSQENGLDTPLLTSMILSGRLEASKGMVATWIVNEFATRFVDPSKSVSRLEKAGAGIAPGDDHGPEERSEQWYCLN